MEVFRTMLPLQDWCVKNMCNNNYISVSLNGVELFKTYWNVTYYKRFTNERILQLHHVEPTLKYVSSHFIDSGKLSNVVDHITNSIQEVIYNLDNLFCNFKRSLKSDNNKLKLHISGTDVELEYEDKKFEPNTGFKPCLLGELEREEAYSKFLEEILGVSVDTKSLEELENYVNKQ